MTQSLSGRKECHTADRSPDRLQCPAPIRRVTHFFVIHSLLLVPPSPLPLNPSPAFLSSVALLTFRLLRRSSVLSRGRFFLREFPHCSCCSLRQVLHSTIPIPPVLSLLRLDSFGSFYCTAKIWGEGKYFESAWTWKEEVGKILVDEFIDEKWLRIVKRGVGGQGLELPRSNCALGLTIWEETIWLKSRSAGKCMDGYDEGDWLLHLVMSLRVMPFAFTCCCESDL